LRVPIPIPIANSRAGCPCHGFARPCRAGEVGGGVTRGAASLAPGSLRPALQAGRRFSSGLRVPVKLLFDRTHRIYRIPFIIFTRSKRGS
jgi:hypothetical protein